MRPQTLHRELVACCDVSEIFSTLEQPLEILLWPKKKGQIRLRMRAFNYKL